MTCPKVAFQRDDRVILHRVAVSLMAFLAAVLLGAAAEAEVGTSALTARANARWIGICPPRPPDGMMSLSWMYTSNH